MAGFFPKGGSGSAVVGGINRYPILITNTMLTNRAIDLPATPYGTVILYLEGCVPQLSGVAFTISGDTLSWDAGSWFDSYLQVNEVVYVLYATAATCALTTESFEVDATVLTNRSVSFVAIPTNSVTLYVAGSSPLLENVSFSRTNEVVSWTAGSWLGSNLQLGDFLYFVY